MNDLIYNTMFFLLIIKLLMTMYQRRFADDGTYKRLISLYQSVGLGIIYTFMSIIKAKGFNENYIVLVFILGIAAFVLLRKFLFPYSFKCKNCNKKLKISQVLYVDSPKCSKCDIID